MLVTDSRPRTLKWYHAGPLLFGDWGTSRLYVLGLAFYYTGHASPLYLALMSLIMIVVAWAYTVVCRCFPDGGGVYAAARPLSHTLSAVAATLLLCGYIVTAALSVVEGYHYFGIRADLVVLLSVTTIAVIGVINWLGARSAGRFALVTAIAAVIMSAFIGVLCIPMAIEGASSASATVPGVDTTWDRWESLVRIVLALAGVEAVANMTGLMRPPVRRTAKRTIWPVLIEVVVLNLLFGLALNALPQLKPYTVPDYVTFEQGLNQFGPNGTPVRFEPQDVPDEVKQYRDTAVKVLATHAAGEALGAPTGRVFGVMSGVIFGLLLMSAVNTAVMAMVSVLFSLAQDRELPRAFTRLNYSGVPWIGLLVACALPIAMLVFVGSDAKMLGELYAVGVVGAIAINVLSCAFNRSLSIGRYERAFMWALGALMVAIEATIIVAKPRATVFAGSIIATVLLVRFLLKRRARAEAEIPPLPTPEAGWLAEVRRAPVAIEPGKPRIMLAARGRYQSEFAVDLARRRGAVLFAIYVRTLRVMDVQPGAVPRIEDDPVAQESLGTTAILAREAGVPFVPIYVTSADIPSEILDYTVTYGCDTLIMGKSRRSLFSRRVTGDVVAEVARHLPDNVALITRATDAPFIPGQPRADE